MGSLTAAADRRVPVKKERKKRKNSTVKLTAVPTNVGLPNYEPQSYSSIRAEVIPNHRRNFGQNMTLVRVVNIAVLTGLLLPIVSAILFTALHVCNAVLPIAKVSVRPSVRPSVCPSVRPSVTA